MKTDRAAEERFAWVGFAGFMTMVSGAATVVQGLWALDHKDSEATRSVAAQLSYGSLETWGWIMIVWGVLMMVASFAILPQAAFFWVFAFPLAAFGVVFIDVLVLYALFTHVGGDAPIA